MLMVESGSGWLKSPIGEVIPRRSMEKAELIVIKMAELQQAEGVEERTEGPQSSNLELWVLLKEVTRSCQRGSTRSAVEDETVAVSADRNCLWLAGVKK